MHLPNHLVISWLIGSPLRERRDRRIVAWAGVAPDLDALSRLAGQGAFSEYHHVLTHGIVAAVAFTILWTAFARQRIRVLILSLVAFHVHLICDLLGSGKDWPIVYFYPFSRHEYLTPYGWPLASPQNGILWLLAVALSIWIGVKMGRTFGETFLPARADEAIVQVLRKWLPRKAVQSTGA